MFVGHSVALKAVDWDTGMVVLKAKVKAENLGTAMVVKMVVM